MPLYDSIAAIYDADMGASMPFDDVGCYRALALEQGGPVLELGCGTGRVGGALQAAGIEVLGIDRSLPMLAEARRRWPALALTCMDMCRLALTRRFRLALLPYSLVTHLHEEQHWQALATGLKAALLPGARIVVDAFLPRPELADGRWQQDYIRPLRLPGRFRDDWLHRHKRIQPLPDGRHRIDRRYRLRGAFAGRSLHTREIIRPYPPEQLQTLAEKHLGSVERSLYDYRQAPRSDSTRFCTLLLRHAP